MLSDILNALCFCSKPQEKKFTVNIESNTFTIQNEKNIKSTTTIKEKDSRNEELLNMISINPAKIYSTISIAIPQGILQNKSNYNNNKDKKIRKYLKKVSKKKNKTVNEIYDEFLNKIDYIIEEFEKKRTISESDDYY